MIFTIIIFLFFSCIYSIWPLAKENKWAELSVVILIFLVASLYGVQYQFDLSFLPNPGNLIVKLQPWAQSLGRLTELN